MTTTTQEDYVLDGSQPVGFFEGEMYGKTKKLTVKDLHDSMVIGRKSSARVSSFGLDTKPSQKQPKLGTIKEYNDNTSLHGPKYMTEDGSHAVEKYKIFSKEDFHSTTLLTL